jgi:hypothetical protein
MLRGLVIVLVASAVVAVGLLEGIWSNRWGSSEDNELTAARLERIPMNLGNWMGTDAPLDAKIIRVAEATGSLSRVYVNRQTGARIDILLLTGPTGPIGAHTPDVCYGGLGYSMQGTAKPVRIDWSGGHADFWNARFVKKVRFDGSLQVFWAWGVDGNWEASINPRADFALRSTLNKLYVVLMDNRADEMHQPDLNTFKEFLGEFLPLVKKALGSDAGS